MWQPCVGFERASRSKEEKVEAKVGNSGQVHGKEQLQQGQGNKQRHQGLGNEEHQHVLGSEQPKQVLGKEQLKQARAAAGFTGKKAFTIMVP